MAVATFDTLRFANTLKAAGVPDKQAEAQAVAFAEVIQLNLKDLVMKVDLEQAVADLRRGLAEVKTELTREIADSNTKLTREIKDAQQLTNAKLDTSISKSDLSIAKMQGEIVLLRWITGVATLGVIGVLVRLFFFRGL